jgi:hypothetical protein
MQIPTYLSLSQVRTELAEMGIKLSDRQIKRAADKDAHGKRKLPFFVDPITGRLKIERGALVAAYRKLQTDAENNLQE